MFLTNRISRLKSVVVQQVARKWLIFNLPYNWLHFLVSRLMIFFFFLWGGVCWGADLPAWRSCKKEITILRLLHNQVTLTIDNVSPQVHWRILNRKDTCRLTKTSPIFIAEISLACCFVVSIDSFKA